MQISVKLFGPYREWMRNERVLVLELPDGATAGDVWRRLAQQVPRLGATRPGVAVNLEHAALERVLQDGDEVGFLPPVAGGQTET